jgi:RNA polymerase sigma factor (sigma-70 family)
VVRKEVSAEDGLRHGVEEALVSLYSTEWERLSRLAGFLTGDWHLGQDLASDVFQKARHAWLGRGLPDLPAAYLRVAVVNQSRSACTARAQRMEHPLDGADFGGLSASGLAELHEDERLVLLALGRLSSRQRDCLVLRYYFDLNDRDVAQSLGVSLGTAKTHIRRGLSALRKSLKGTTL